jgi:iron(III) transport system permease protein
MPPPRAPELWTTLTASTLRWFLIAAIAICCGLPLIWVVFEIVSNHHVLVELKVDPGFRYRLLAHTLMYNMTAAFIAVVLAIPAGLALGRGRGGRSVLLWIALPIGLLLPSIVFAYGWKQFLRLFGYDLDPAGVADIFRCIWTLSTWLWPLPAALMGLSLRRLDTQVQEQALLDGVLWRITLRHLLAPALAAFCMCTVLSVQEFAVYEPTGISVVATETRMVFETGAFSSPTNPITQTFGPIGSRGENSNEELVGVTGQAARAAAALATSLPLLVTMALLSLIAYLAARELSVTEAVQVGPWPRALNARRWVIALAWVVIVVTVAVPIAAMYFSLKRHLSPAAVFNEFAPQASGSIVIAFTSGIVGLLLALSGALRRRPLAIVMGGITFLIGGQMLAIALIRLYNRPSLNWVYNGLPIIVMAYVGRFGWMALLAAGLSWSRPWRELRDLASVDGATPAQTAWHVIWPLAWPILGASAMLVMILSLTEVPATVLISPQRPQPLVPMLMTWVHMLRYDSMIEGSLLLCGLVLVLAIGALVLTIVGSRAVRVMSSKAPIIRGRA